MKDLHDLNNKLTILLGQLYIVRHTLTEEQMKDVRIHLDKMNVAGIEMFNILQAMNNIKKAA